MLLQGPRRIFGRAVLGRGYCDCPPEPTKFTKEHLKELSQKVNADKISVIGAGAVGIACCAFILQKRLTSNLVMVDLREDWIKAEALDFLHASCLLGSPKIQTCTDGRNTAGSKYIVITAGMRPKKGQSRLDVAQQTADMLVKAVPTLMDGSPEATFVICSNPADVMTWVVQQLLELPKYRCISSGCHLDSLRFRYFIAQRLGVSPSSVNGFIIGEHGNSSVPVWSGVTIGGIPLMRILPAIGTDDDEEKWSEVHTKVVKAASDVSGIKGYTNWAIGLCVADIISAMMENSGRIMSVGTDVQGLMGIEDSCVMSLPSILSMDGIVQMIELPLSDFEMDLLHKSAKTIQDAQSSLKL